ncbi:MAG: hypothetical protein KVP17_004424, partial [Porospora cf. gigantea B]|uniref:uncharacterized protein n=1 Tax=Porospora cf. gigantea B TaxID=2853592 RepID=UPI003571D0A2
VTLFILLHGISARAAAGSGLKRAVSIADKAYSEFQPNVMVASSSGCIVALQMTSPKLPTLFICPLAEYYRRFMNISRKPSVADFPKIIILHGSRDREVKVVDSIRLVETGQMRQAKLEVVEDTHRLAGVIDDDYL